MGRNNLVIYVFLSVLIHAGAAALLKNYRLAEREEPERTVQVEVAAIRELPVVPMVAPISIPEPEIFETPSAAFAGIGIRFPSAPKTAAPPEPFMAALQPSVESPSAMTPSPAAREKPFEPVANRSLAIRQNKRQTANESKQPEFLTDSVSVPPVADMPFTMTLAATSQSMSPETMASLPVESPNESPAISGTVEPLAFEDQIAIEVEKAKGDLRMTASGRPKTEPATRAAGSLPRRRLFQPAPPAAPEMIAETAAAFPDSGLPMALAPGPTSKEVVVSPPRQAGPSARSPAVSSAPGFQVAVLSPAAPSLLPQTQGPVLPEPPSRPPESYLPGTPDGAAILLLVDTSGSVKGPPWEGIKRAVKDLVGFMGEKDRAAIMAFDDSVRPVSDFTSDKEHLTSKIEQLRTQGRQTLLYDALAEAAEDLRLEDRTDRHVFLFSDGKDEGSRTEFDQVLQALAEAGVSVFAVGFTRVEEQYLDILERLAEQTGGIFVQTPAFRELLALYKTAGPSAKKPSGNSDKNIVDLMVTSDPADARIFIDGDFRGRTPATLSVPAGKYEIRIEKKGFYSWEAQVEVSRSRRWIESSLLPVDGR